MSYSLAIIKATSGAGAAQSGLEDLRRIKVPGAKLFLFTDHKFDSRKLAAVRNIEGDYPLATVILRNTAMMATAVGAAPDYYQDGYDLLCLERAMRKEAQNCFILMRDLCNPSENDLNWLRRNKREPFRILKGGERASVLFDCRLDQTRRAIELAADFYRSGALLSLSERSLLQALRIASQVVINGPYTEGAVYFPDLSTRSVPAKAARFDRLRSFWHRVRQRTSWR